MYLFNVEVGLFHFFCIPADSNTYFCMIALHQNIYIIKNLDENPLSLINQDV